MTELTKAFIPYELTPGDKQYICLTFHGTISRKAVKQKVKEYIKQAFGTTVPAAFINHDVQYDHFDSEDQYISMRDKLQAFDTWLRELEKEVDEEDQAGGVAPSEGSTPEETRLQVRSLSDRFNGQAGRSMC